MKKYIFVYILFLFVGKIVSAQDSLVDKSPTVVFLFKRGYTFPDSSNKKKTVAPVRNWPDSLYYNTVYISRLLGSPTVPISFSRIEYVDGKYQVSPTISIGYGYTWFTGDFIFSESDKIIINPKFFFGIVGDIGLQNDFTFKKFAGIFTGGFIGFGPFSLFAGFDFISKSPSIGLGGRIDLYTISQNYLKPIGKIKELRKHKRAATIISNE